MRHLGGIPGQRRDLRGHPASVRGEARPGAARSTHRAGRQRRARAFREFVGDWLGFIAGEKNGFLQHAEGDARPKTLHAALGSSATTQTDSAADSAESRGGAGGGGGYRRGAAADKVTYGFVAEAEPTAEEKATAELAAKKRKAEAEVKATLEKAKEDAEAATGGIDWKAMRVVDDDEEAFYGTYDREKMKPKEYKYLDESAPMYESIEEADAAFEAAQKQKEADEKERAAEAAAGREAKTRAEKIAEEGDGHWHSKRGRGGVPLAEALRAKHLDTEVGAIGMRPLRHHIHFDDEPLPSPAARGSGADAKAARRRGGRGGRPSGASAARMAPRPLRNRKKSRARAFPRRTRAPGSSRCWTRTGTSARSSPWSETRGRRSLARSRRRLHRRLPSVRRLRRARAKDEARGSRRWARRGGARATQRARGLLAAGGGGGRRGVRGDEARERQTASDAERVPDRGRREIARRLKKTRLADVKPEAKSVWLGSIADASFYFILTRSRSSRG